MTEKCGKVTSRRKVSESIHVAAQAAGEHPGQETLLSGRDDSQAPAEGEVRRYWGLSVDTRGRVKEGVTHSPRTRAFGMRDGRVGL